MGYVSDATIARFRGAYNLGLFFRLMTSPPLRLWWGVSDRPAQLDALDVGGTVYNGGGVLLDIPDALEVLINGTASRVDWQLSGVSLADAAHVAANAPDVVGAPFDFAIAALDDRWQIAGELISICAGTADFWSESQPRQPDPTKPRLRTLTLSTTIGEPARALSHFSTWTDLDQRAISPGDNFCNRVPRYYQGLQITWPRF